MTDTLTIDLRPGMRRGPSDLEVMTFLLRRVGRVPRRAQIATDLIRMALDAPFGRERQIEALRHAAGLYVHADTAGALMSFLRRLHRLLRIAARHDHHLIAVLTAGAPSGFSHHAYIESVEFSPRPDWYTVDAWRSYRDHHIAGARIAA